MNSHLGNENRTSNAGSQFYCLRSTISEAYFDADGGTLIILSPAEVVWCLLMKPREDYHESRYRFDRKY